jgi:hypothetical protein
MRALTWILGVIIVTLIATQVSATEMAASRAPASGVRHSCKIVTGYGTAIGYGQSDLAAKEAARELCGTKIIDDYMARRGHIEDSVVDDLALACVNLECQK